MMEHTYGVKSFFERRHGRSEPQKDFLALGIGILDEVRAPTQ